MSVFIATTYITILRGTAIDEFGDEVDTDTEMADRLPATIVETSQRTWNPVEQRAGVIEQYTIRLRPSVNVAENDRIRDERTGVIYQVREVSNPPSLVGLADRRVTAVRVSAQS